MTTIERVRRSQILFGVCALVLAVPVVFAESPDPNATASIKSVVRTGDLIAVTRWSAGKVKGQVIETTECSVVLRAAGGSLAIPNAAIKTVRRYPPAQPKPGAKALLGVARRCERVDCEPATLAYVGLAALFKGFDGLGRRPKIVYRGTRGQSSGGSCSGPGHATAPASMGLS